MKKAVFLDRDGVINRKAPEGGYITRWQDMEILPRVADAIARLNHAGFDVVVVTNQRCVSKGLITENDLQVLHEQLRSALGRMGAQIDAIYYCPHASQPACRCRKPAPGMFLDAARDRGIDLRASWMVGDSQVDIEAGRSAGCRTVLLTRDAPTASDFHDIASRNLSEAVDSILASAPANTVKNPPLVQR